MSPGQVVKVSYGNFNGSWQVAVVVEVGHWPRFHDRVKIRKWLDNSRRFTKPIWVAARTISADLSDRGNAVLERVRAAL